MADRFLINGGRALKGVVEISGSKNAAGAILAATLLTTEECIIENIPKVLDVLNLLKILEKMGVEISWEGESRVRIKAGANTDPQKIEFDLAFEMSKNLEAKKIEKVAHTEKLAVALACLSEAADLLDNMKEFASSEALTQVIEKIANKKA